MGKVVMKSKGWEVSGCPRALGPQGSQGLCGQDTVSAQAAPICLVWLYPMGT